MKSLSQEISAQGYLRLPDVLRLIPVSKSSWWLGIQRGVYPKPVKLSARTTAWRVADIQMLIDRIDTQGLTAPEIAPEKE